MTRAPAESLRRPATATDVAAMAGVSQSAVSRVFTPGASVSADMRAKVEAAARSLGYRPNLIARSLITRRSRIIGVAMAYMQNQFYPALLEALSTRLHAAGYRILLFTPEPDASGDPVLEEVLRYQVDALVLASTALSSHLAEDCRRAGVPVVMVNRRASAASVSSVTGQNDIGGEVIARFLAAGGHRRPAFIAGLEDSSTSRSREAGFARGLKALGLPAPLRASGHYTFEGAREATRALLSGPDRPDAIFCANDHMAFAALETARSEFGLEVGRELSIVGFDDVDLAAWPSFSLTTFSQPVAAMADQVVAILERLLAEPSAPSAEQMAPGALIVRDSARRPRQGLSMVDGRTVWSL